MTLRVCSSCGKSEDVKRKSPTSKCRTCCKLEDNRNRYVTDNIRRNRVKNVKTPKKCICCKSKELHHPLQKYCTYCSLFTKELKQQVAYHKNKCKVYCKMLYGVDNGAERVRRKNG